MEFPLVSQQNRDLDCCVRKKGLSNQEFLGRVREYLPEESGICETDGSGNCLCEIPVRDLEENTFYLFDSNALLALSDSVEDIALEEGNGDFLAAIQTNTQFEPHRDRYRQLASTLDEVRIIASGKLPRRQGRMTFCNDSRFLVKKFWMALYQGQKVQALFLGEQANDAENFDDKKFTGFYTFDPRIISQARADITEALAGRCPELWQFAQLHRLDRAAKQIKIEFAREKKAMEIAIKKLRGGKKYQPKHFLEELNKTLERLNRLKTHLPEMISGHQKHD